MNFLTRNKLRLVKTAETSAGTEVKTAAVDTAGFEGAVFFGSISTANAGNYMKAQESDTTTDGDFVDLVGTKVVAAANGDVVAVEVYRPSKRYIRASIIRGGTNTVTGDVYVNLYGPAVMPVDNNEASEIVSETHPTPAAGAA